MPYNFAADSFHTKKTLQQTYFKQSAILQRNRPFCVFETPFGDLRGLSLIHISEPTRRTPISYRFGVIAAYCSNFAPTRSLWSAPINHFCTVSQANECLTTLPLTVFTQRNFVADFLQAKSDFFTEIGRFVFLRPLLGDLEATYDDHLRLIGKRVVDFLLALTELFQLGVTAEALRAIIGSESAILLQRGQVEATAPHHPFFFSENQAKLSFVGYKNLDRSSFCFVTIHACDRQTDRILIATPRLHYMQRGKNCKRKHMTCTGNSRKIS